MIQTITFAPGDIVRVHQKIQEGEKSRIQVFQGTVIQIRGRGLNKSFTVKKEVGGIAVEKIWQVDSPNIDKVEVTAAPKDKPRRARLTYLHKAKVRP